MKFEKKFYPYTYGENIPPKTKGWWDSGVWADCIIVPEPTLEGLRAQVSDLSYVLIHHTNDWCINRLCQRADTKLI